MVELEKTGIPTVSWVAQGFIKDALGSARAFGVATLSIADMPHTFTNQSPEIIKDMVGASIDQIIQGLTEPPEAMHLADEGFTTISDPVLTFEAVDLLETMETMNRRFLEWRWSDGFPLVPPTLDRVERMLEGTSRAPQDVIATLEPGFGVATVEKIAVNAVMAGCRPEHRTSRTPYPGQRAHRRGTWH